MEDAAGFRFERIAGGGSRLAPVVLLHGSGGCERSMVDLGRSIAPDRAGLAVRGRVPWEDGHAFFRRNPDRSLDRQDLAARCSEFCDFLGHLVAGGGRPPILIGFSNGAIMAAAAILCAPTLSSGAILLRPLSPRAGERFPPLHGYPVLLLGGANDARRHPSDTPHLAGQFRQAGAVVTAHVLPAGHALDESGADHRLAREWLADRR